jgi:hypothetical protein
MTGLKAEDLKTLEDGIRMVFREGGEEMARSICVGELQPFGEAIIAHEKALVKLGN